MLLKIRIILSCSIIILFFFSGEKSYALKQLGFKEIIEVSTTDSLVRGRVIDMNGEPLIGANVREKGGTKGTATDVNGNFILSVPDSAILEISFVGYKTMEISVAGKKTLEVCLVENTLILFGLFCPEYKRERIESGERSEYDHCFSRKSSRSTD